MPPSLNKEGFDKIMTRLYRGGPPAYGSKEDDVWVLAHCLKALVNEAALKEDGDSIHDKLKELA